MQRNDLIQNVEMLRKNDVFVFFSEQSALGAQLAQRCVALEGERVNPGEVEEDLQIAQVGFAEAAQRFAGAVLAGRPPQVQLVISAQRTNQAVEIRHEEVVEYIHGVGFAEIG